MRNLLRCALMLPVLFAAIARPQAAPAVDSAVAAQHPITEAQLRTYFEESLLQQQMQTNIQDELDQRKTSLPWMPDAVWHIVKDKVAAVDLVKLLLPAYQKYFTEEDGNAISLMFDGPTGHALAAASVQVHEAAEREAKAASSTDAVIPPSPPIPNVGELTRKRQAELTPEQIAAMQKSRMATAVKTLDGLRIDEEQNTVLSKMMEDTVRATLVAHQKELVAARHAYYAKH